MLYLRNLVSFMLCRNSTKRMAACQDMEVNSLCQLNVALEICFSEIIKHYLDENNAD